MKTRFILIQTSHAGNVGAAARAMKTMGFDDLVLVKPRWANVLRREETIQRASGALDVLHNARIVETLDEALDGISHLCATAMTPRDFGPPTRAPREHFDLLLKKELPALDGQCAGGQKRFNSRAGGGPKRHRLSVWLRALRHGQRGRVPLPCGALHPHQPAVRLAQPGRGHPGHRLRVAPGLGGFGVEQATPERLLADAGQVAGMLAHWEQALTAIGFLDPAAPKKLMPRLNQLFNRAQLGAEEIHILRGVAKAMIESAQPKR
jgi:tRNA/rRNA methyltransferase